MSTQEFLSPNLLFTTENNTTFLLYSFYRIFLAKDLVKSLKEIQINHLNYTVLVWMTSVCERNLHACWISVRNDVVRSQRHNLLLRKN